MSDKQAAFADLQRFVAMFKNIATAAPDLAAIGSIEQATAEAQAKLDATRKAAAEAEAAHVQATQGRQAAAESVATSIKSAAIQARAEADSYATQVRARAEQDAAQIVKLAGAAAEKVKADAEAALASLKQDVVATQKFLGELKAEITKATTAHMAAVSDLTETQAMHDRIKAVLAETKARLG